MTLESTAALEDIIKQRIADEAWDDVERKEPPKPAPSSELPEVSQEKSKEGLADIYAKDYAKQVLGASGPDAKQQTRDEISMLYTKLCGKLDALTSALMLALQAFVASLADPSRRWCSCSVARQTSTSRPSPSWRTSRSSPTCQRWPWRK